jgi:hypothetical protein
MAAGTKRILEFCMLPGTLHVDNANLKLHHFFSILV